MLGSRFGPLLFRSCHIARSLVVKVLGPSGLIMEALGC